MQEIWLEVFYKVSYLKYKHLSKQNIDIKTCEQTSYSYCVLYTLSFTVCKYCMYCHLLFVNKHARSCVYILVPTRIFIMSTPLGGGYIIFAFFAVRCPMSGVRCPASRMVSAHLKEKY